MSFYFLYQRKGGEESWVLDFAAKRQEVVAALQPAFVTALDLSAIPEDNDWTKVRYQGPMYFDFDADGDLELACTQFLIFLDKLEADYQFDLTQARLYASGGKGFHVEIPAECLMPKVPATGTTWLPYIYRTVAEKLVVDTMDMRVYTGKRGRMWRTPGVQRESGAYKVPLTLDEAWSITPDLYRELCSSARTVPAAAPPTCNSKLAMLFQTGKEKIVTQMRGKKKRMTVANSFLDPWKKAKKHPPTILGIMDGSLVAQDAGFQSLSMQLAIYATSVGMDLDEFLERCKGLCENHVSDSHRYNSFAKRQEELARMWRYMSEDSLYDFATEPLVKLVKSGTPTPDMGVMQTTDDEDEPQAQAQADGDAEDGDTVSEVAAPKGDSHKGIRKGFFMNGDGMFRKLGDVIESICRATLRKVDAFIDMETMAFKGYEFDLVVHGQKTQRVMLGSEAFTSAMNLKKFFAAYQLSFMGGEAETAALLDIMAEKSKRGGRIFTWPREGFFIVDNPLSDDRDPVKIYLTQHHFMSSVPEDDPKYFRMRYRPTQSTSAYNIDIHRAPELDDSMIPALHDLFTFNRDDVVADMLGWFIACHYRSVYLHLFNQFPLLQVYGEAGAGKTQTALLLGHLHWFLTPVSVKSAASGTAYVVDSFASTSTSAPYLIDEYKPREMRAARGDRHSKLKDLLKASYVGGDIGGRGTLNKGGPETAIGVISSKATAPIVFMGEAIEMETAIIERSVCVNFTKMFFTTRRKEAFERLQANPVALSALGRTFVEMGFGLDLDKMRKDVRSIQAEINARMPDFDDDTVKRVSERTIFNRAVIIHALRTLKAVLSSRYGSEFDASIDALLNYKAEESSSEQAKVIASMGISEVSKVLTRIAMLSRSVGEHWEMKEGLDYVVGEGWVEVKIDRGYDNYRRFCATHNETPLFDSMDTFGHAVNAYSACLDRVCASSELRDDDSSEKVVRFDTRKLAKEGVQSFRRK